MVKFITNLILMVKLLVSQISKKNLKFIGDSNFKSWNALLRIQVFKLHRRKKVMCSQTNSCTLIFYLFPFQEVGIEMNQLQNNQEQLYSFHLCFFKKFLQSFVLVLRTFTLISYLSPINKIPGIAAKFVIFYDIQVFLFSYMEWKCFVYFGVSGNCNRSLDFLLNQHQARCNNVHYSAIK